LQQVPAVAGISHQAASPSCPDHREAASGPAGGPTPVGVGPLGVPATRADDRQHRRVAALVVVGARRSATRADPDDARVLSDVVGVHELLLSSGSVRIWRWVESGKTRWRRLIGDRAGSRVAPCHQDVTRIAYAALGPEERGESKLGGSCPRPSIWNSTSPRSRPEPFGLSTSGHVLEWTATPLFEGIPLLAASHVTSWMTAPEAS
jgi:hypothetical protein